MKKAITKITLAIASLFLLTMCKNPDIEYSIFSIAHDTIIPEARKAEVIGEFDFLGEVSDMKISVGRDEQLTDAKNYLMNVDRHSFSTSIDSLVPNTLYYYCYVIEFPDNHTYSTCEIEIGEFTTLSDKPLVRTLEVNANANSPTSFSVKSIVDNDCGMAITERGICWGLNDNPSLDDNYIRHEENGIGEYTCNITGLELNTTYFVRAYAKNGIDLSYAEEVIRFETAALPTVETLPIGDLTPTVVMCKGRITNGDLNLVRSFGIQIGQTQNLDDGGTNLEGTILNTNNGIEFGAFISDFDPNTTYYYRAYAIYTEGTSGYGEILEFTTLPKQK